MILAQKISALFLSYKTRKNEMKNILEGIIWILVTGSQRHLLPRENFPPKGITLVTPLSLKLFLQQSPFIYY